MPLQRFRKFWQMDENRLPIGIDSEVDNVFQVLFFIVTGEHGAYYFGILSEIIIPRRGAVLADWWKSAVALCDAFSYRRVIAAKMNHIFTKFKDISMSINCLDNRDCCCQTGCHRIHRRIRTSESHGCISIQRKRF